LKDINLGVSTPKLIPSSSFFLYCLNIIDISYWKFINLVLSIQIKNFLS
jgi:hypothetical protein